MRVLRYRASSQECYVLRCIVELSGLRVHVFRGLGLRVTRGSPAIRVLTSERFSPGVVGWVEALTTEF